jgi:hypothetical protein
VTQGVGSDRLDDAGKVGETPHDSPDGVPVQAAAVRSGEDGPVETDPTAQVDPEPSEAPGEW